MLLILILERHLSFMLKLGRSSGFVLNVASFGLQVMIFFSAHGVPVSYVENAGDPYKDEMEECIYLIMQELKARGIGNEHTLAYQVSNRFCLASYLFLAFQKHVGLLSN